MNFLSSSHAAIVAARNLISALNNPSPASPICPLRNSQREQLHQLADIFTQHTVCTPPQTQKPSQPAPIITTIAVAPYATTRVSATLNTDNRVILQDNTPPPLRDWNAPPPRVAPWRGEPAPPALPRVAPPHTNIVPPEPHISPIIPQ
jgi:hypothetical protein